MLPFRSIILFAALLPFSASAVVVQITYENLAPTSPTGLYLSPVWAGFHDGTFDSFDSGAAASGAIEAVAELGDSSSLDTMFSGVVPAGLSVTVNDPDGPGPGLLVPGASVSFNVDLDATNQRYLSFAAMVVPSNDTFIANDNPLAIELFDSMGSFLGDQSWTLTGENVWDAGTEVNSLADGGAFVVGVDATSGVTESGSITLQSLDGLDEAIGMTTPAGTTIGEALTTDGLFRISVNTTVVPEPSTYALFLGASGLLLAGWRRRRSRTMTAIRPA